MLHTALDYIIASMIVWTIALAFSLTLLAIQNIYQKANELSKQQN